MSTINNLTLLHFFTENGHELYSQKTYVLQWVLIPNGNILKYVKTRPKGYFIADITTYTDNETNISYTTIEPGTLILLFLDNGNIFYEQSENKSKEEFLKEILLNCRISISVQNNGNAYNISEEITNIIDIDKITNKSYTSKKIYYGDNSLEYYKNKDVVINNNEYFEYINITHLDLKLLKAINSETSVTVIESIFIKNIDNIGSLFPFVKYQINLEQDSISTNFINPTTLLILQQNNNNEMCTPYIEEPYEMIFGTSNDGEIHILTLTENNELLFNNEYICNSLNNTIEDNKAVNPISLIIGTMSKEEGCYQNYLGIYIRQSSGNSINNNPLYFLGAISIKTEVIGEDERFRTLLTNFGIPDPVNYYNILSDYEFDEALPDYKVINNKSKELFLTYENIFSYIGTYKALINAIKFLGYNDIVFKEWYKIHDNNDQVRDVAVLVIDYETGKELPNMLKLYNLSIDDYNNYDKLNRLSMIYYLNILDQDNLEQPEQLTLTVPIPSYLYDASDEEKEAYLKSLIDALNKSLNIKLTINDFTETDTLWQYNNKNNEFISNNNTWNFKLNNSNTPQYITDILLTKPIYRYLNTEIIAKLHSLKNWLETNIIGVNAYIHDITGEGLILHLLKTLSYVTLTLLEDFYVEGYYTPTITNISEFINSKANISCTLAEFNNIRIEDYDNITWDHFIKQDISGDAEKMGLEHIYISNLINSPVLADTLEYELKNTAYSATLTNFTDNDYSEIYINDNEILLLNPELKKCVFKILPIINLEIANLRNPEENWDNNILYFIQETIDANTGNTKYKFFNSETQFISNTYIKLVPNNDSICEYTENNKWGVPMFIINNYSVFINNEKIEDFSLNNVILDIIKGHMLFNNTNGTRAELVYSDFKKIINKDENEQAINLHFYTNKLVSLLNIKDDINELIKDNIFDISEDIVSDNDINNIIDNILQLFNFIKNKEHIKNLYKTDTLLDNIKSFISITNKHKKEKENWEKLLDIFFNIEALLITNIEVNQLGNYNITVKAFDGYNNVFVNKSDKEYKIIAEPINYKILLSQEYSNNTKEFYKGNIKGNLIDNNTLDTVFDYLPKYEKAYNIHDIYITSEKNTVLYDNITYALNTPKNNDYFVLRNMSIKCTNIENNIENINLFLLIDDEAYNSPENNSYYKLNLINNNRQNIFINNENFLQTISICEYDPIMYHMTDLITNCKIIESGKEDNFYFNEPYITICLENDNINQQKNSINFLNSFDNNKDYYILNTTKYNLHNEKQVIYVRNNYNNNSCEILFNINEPLFYLNDVIKIRYATNNIINECAFRIIKIIKKDKFTILINGLINDILFNDENINVTISYPYDSLVSYITRVEKDAEEFIQNMDNNYIKICTKFEYNNSQMFLNNYIDNTFEGYIYDFDPENLKRIWVNQEELNKYLTNIELFEYNNYPITTEKDKVLFIIPDNDTDKLFATKDDIKKYIWKWYNYTIDDISNWKTHINNLNKELYFKCINNNISVMCDIEGVNEIELTCIDKYGNTVITKNNGRVYIKSSEN